MRYFRLGPLYGWVGPEYHTDQPNWGVIMCWGRFERDCVGDHHGGYIRLYYGPSAAHKYCSWWCGDVETPHYRSDDGVLHADSSAWTGRRTWGGPRLGWSWF